MSDPITQKHLDRLRIRGAPATIPGAAGLVGEYDAEETWRQTCRALVTPLDRNFNHVALRDAFAKLQRTADAQKLSIAEEPLFALKGDPAVDPPHLWQYEAVLPIRGGAKATDDGITVARIQGGMHIATLTPRGLGDLRNVYVYIFGKFLPAKKQQLMRPYLLHAVPQGLSSARHDDDLVIAVYIPAVLSIKPVPVPGEETTT